LRNSRLAPAVCLRVVKVAGGRESRRERGVQPDQLYFKTAPGEVTFLAGDPQWEHGRTDMQGTNPKLLRIRRTGKRPRPEKKKADNEPILIPVNDTPSGPINFTNPILIWPRPSAGFLRRARSRRPVYKRGRRLDLGPSTSARSRPGTASQ
jgi:hypothetical protein